MNPPFDTTSDHGDAIAGIEADAEDVIREESEARDDWGHPLGCLPVLAAAIFVVAFLVAAAGSAVACSVCGVPFPSIR